MDREAGLLRGEEVETRNGRLQTGGPPHQGRQSSAISELHGLRDGNPRKTEGRGPWGVLLPWLPMTMWFLALFSFPGLGELPL